MMALKEDEAELVRLIAELGTASEVELQAKTLKSLKISYPTRGAE